MAKRDHLSGQRNTEFSSPTLGVPLHTGVSSPFHKAVPVLQSVNVSAQRSEGPL